MNIDVVTATPNVNVDPATIATSDASGNLIDNDYLLQDRDQTVFMLTFGPDTQTLEFNLTLFPDNVPERTKAFQVRSGSVDPPEFLTPVNLFPDIFIFLTDNDCKSFVGLCEFLSLQDLNVSFNVIMF